MQLELRALFEMPDDEEDFKIMSQAREMAYAIDEIREYLRRIRKYSEKDPSFDEIDESITAILSKLNID